MAVEPPILTPSAYLKSALHRTVTMLHWTQRFRVVQDRPPQHLPAGVKRGYNNNNNRYHQRCGDVGGKKPFVKLMALKATRSRFHALYYNVEGLIKVKDVARMAEDEGE